MVADIKVKANTIEVVNYIKKLQRNIPKDIKRALNVVSAYGVQRVTEKTQKGEMPDGGRFAGYSQKAKEDRAKRGRQTENEKAFRHDQGIGKLPRRSFFAIGKQDENKIRDLFFKHIKV